MAGLLPVLRPLKQRPCEDTLDQEGCSLQVCDSKSYKSKEPQELAGSSPHREASPGPGAKEAGQGKDLQEEEAPEERESTEAAQDQPGRSVGSGGTPLPGEPRLCPCPHLILTCFKQERLRANALPIRLLK